MKKTIYIFLFILISNSIYSQSGWVQQSPLPTGEPLRTIKFINNTTGFIGTLYGGILKTTNGGTLWTIKHFNDYEPFSSIDFFDEYTGIAVGSTDSILKTTDGGESWYQYPISIDSAYVNFINCTTNSTAYTIGGYPNNWTMLKTTNKGMNWNLINYGSNHALVSIYFVNENIGYAAANDFAIKTTNGGLSWNQLQFSGGVSSIYFVDQNTGFIVGSGSIEKTTNGGNNWVQQNPFGQLEYENVKFYDSNKGYVIGDETIISTSNGGDSWTYQNNTLVEWLYGLSVINRDTAYLTGDYGVISYTTNGGLNWLSQFSGSDFNLNSIYFTSLNTGYAIGPGGVGYGVRELIKTTNEGNNWLYQSLPAYEDWQKVYFCDDNTGFIVGGSVWKTTDGGFSWSNSSQQNFGFMDINFINNLTGYIAGDNIMKTTNGGINWILLYDTTGFISRYAIKFIDQNTGYEAGETGLIMKTTNGGNNWFAQSSGTDQDLLTEFFINESTGYIGGNDGLIIKTTNGGTNWIPAYNNPSYSITSIFFVNLSTGFAVSDYCGNCSDFILKTTNSGNNWFLSDTTFARVGLNSIFFVNDSVGYTCGQVGMILKTTNGGNPIGINVSKNSEIPKEFKLYQNYPNPFNPKTIINYQLPITGEVKLVIYDLLGRTITTLVNEKQNPGAYKVEWDGSRFASGVYFYQLKTKEFTQTKKLVLIK